MNIYEYMALLAGVLGAIAGIPQLFKLLKTKHSEGISIMLFVMVGSAQLLWVIYGFHKSDYLIILANAAMFILSASIVYLVLKYQNVKTAN